MKNRVRRKKCVNGLRNEENGGWAVKKCGVGDRRRSEDDGE